MAERFLEQKVVHEWEMEFIKRLYPALIKLGVARLYPKAKRDGRSTELPHRYQLGGRDSRARHRRDHRFKTFVVIEGITYTDGDDEEGDTRIYDLGGQTRDWSRILRARASDIGLVVRVSMEMEEENWSEYSTEAHFNITNRTTVKASASVEAGPASAEASAENETITEAGGSFAMDGGGREKKRFVFEDSVTVDAKVGDEFVVSSNIGKVRQVTPVIENGYIEFTGYFDLNDWVDDVKWLKDSIDAGPNIVKFSSIQDLIDFFEGQRVVEYPNMVGWMKFQRDAAKRWPGHRAAALFVDWLKNPENRKVQLRKEKVREYESAGEISTRQVA